MHGQVVCFVAFDQILWLLFGRMNGVALECYWRSHYFLDRPSDTACFRIPFHVIPYFEFVFHIFPSRLNLSLSLHFFERASSKIKNIQFTHLSVLLEKIKVLNFSGVFISLFFCSQFALRCRLWPCVHYGQNQANLL